jgi:peptide-methionine (R)-S-oxide reductase
MFKILCLLTLISFSACGQETKKSSNNVKTDNKTKYNKMENNNNPYYQPNQKEAVVVPDSVWKNILAPEVYNVARQKGTERPFTSPFEESKEVGTYHCAICGNALFKSNAKFNSGCGWPSFFEPIHKGAIIYTPDNTHGMQRTEVQCGKCKSHLGHVFEDGPPPTGLRYCINGVVLTIEKSKE